MTWSAQHPMSAPERAPSRVHAGGLELPSLASGWCQCGRHQAICNTHMCSRAAPRAHHLSHCNTPCHDRRHCAICINQLHLIGRIASQVAAMALSCLPTLQHCGPVGRHAMCTPCISCAVLLSPVLHCRRRHMLTSTCIAACRLVVRLPMHCNADPSARACTSCAQRRRLCSPCARADAAQCASGRGTRTRCASTRCRTPPQPAV